MSLDTIITLAIIVLGAVSALGGGRNSAAQQQARRQAEARRKASQGGLTTRPAQEMTTQSAQEQARRQGDSRRQALDAARRKGGETLEQYLAETAVPEDDPLGHRAQGAASRALDTSSRGGEAQGRADQEALRREMARKLGRDEPQRGPATVRTLAEDARQNRLKTTRSDVSRASQAPNLSDHKSVVMPNQQAVVMATTGTVVMPSAAPTIGSGPTLSLRESGLLSAPPAKVNLREDVTGGLPPARPITGSLSGAASVNPATPRFTRGAIVQGVILAEVLGPPLSRRRRHGPFRQRVL